MNWCPRSWLARKLVSHPDLERVGEGWDALSPQIQRLTRFDHRLQPRKQLPGSLHRVLARRVIIVQADMFHRQPRAGSDRLQLIDQFRYKTLATWTICSAQNPRRIAFENRA